MKATTKPAAKAGMSEACKMLRLFNKSYPTAAHMAGTATVNEGHSTLLCARYQPACRLVIWRQHGTPQATWPGTETAPQRAHDANAMLRPKTPSARPPALDEDNGDSTDPETNSHNVGVVKEVFFDNAAQVPRQEWVWWSCEISNPWVPAQPWCPTACKKLAACLCTRRLRLK